jgi:hypothetical protein
MKGVDQILLTSAIVVAVIQGFITTAFLSLHGLPTFVDCGSVKESNGGRQLLPSRRGGMPTSNSET